MIHPDTTEDVLAALRAAVADETGASDAGAIEALVGAPAAVAERLRLDRACDFLPVPVQERLSPNPIQQTSGPGGREIHTVTTVRLAGVSPERLTAGVLEERWTWWKGGRISGWERTSGGGTRFVLWPVWLRSPAQVGIDLSPAVSQTEPAWEREHAKTVVAARFFKDFAGPGAYEILPVRGGCVLRSIWAGVTTKGATALMPVSFIRKVHLGAEAGTLSFPFRSGTGFPGLIAHLVRP